MQHSNMRIGAEAWAATLWITLHFSPTARSSQTLCLSGYWRRGGAGGARTRHPDTRSARGRGTASAHFTTPSPERQSPSAASTCRARATASHMSLQARPVTLCCRHI